MAESASFDCRKGKDSSIEKMICADELAKLHPQTRRLYAAASKKAVNERPPVLTAAGLDQGAQRMWEERQ
jgi:uncharacterized protein